MKEPHCELTRTRAVASRTTVQVHFSGNSTMEGAINWLEEHGEDADLDEPLLVAKSESVWPRLVLTAAAPCCPRVQGCEMGPVSPHKRMPPSCARPHQLCAHDGIAVAGAEAEADTRGSKAARGRAAGTRESKTRGGRASERQREREAAHSDGQAVDRRREGGAGAAVQALGGGP